MFPHRSSAASSGPSLTGADGKPISAWGKVTKKLNFGLHTFIVSFILAAVSKPSISSQLTACWLIRSQGPCYLLHLCSQWVTQSQPPLPSLPRLFLTLFLRFAPSCRRFPALSATARVLLGHVTASTILLKPLVGLSLPKLATWIQTS